MEPEFQDFNILTPNAMLGYGYRKDHFWYGIEKYKPAAIIVDSGSTDGGPYKLGLNKMTCGRGSYIRDLEPILAAAFHHRIKVLIGSVGGDGSTKHVEEMFEMVSEIANANGYSFNIATIDAGMDRRMIKDRIRTKKVSPCGPVAPLTEEDVDKAVDVVAQMGAEPYLDALNGDPDIILGGRSYDPAPFAAFCLSRGVAPGVAWHMGKIMECGGICAIPKGRSMIATIRKDSFDLTPLAAEERCTPLSVASHTLYEKTRPDRLPGPGGYLDLVDAQYHQLTEKTTRISGANFVSVPYQVKLEGVQHLGYRTIFIGGVRDPILISQIDDFLDKVRKYSQGLFPELDASENCRLVYHVYGKNAVMGPLEPEHANPTEIGILGEVLAPTQVLSHTIANNVRASLLHFPYPGQLATTGNFASPLSPHEQEAGPVFKFSLYHLVDLEPGEERSLFQIKSRCIRAISSPAVCPTIANEDFKRLDQGNLACIEERETPTGVAKMSELARIVRSKNSGPFELTFDIMFSSESVYERVKAANVLTNDVIKAKYHIEEDDILINMYFDPALAWKCTIKRPWAQGSVGERDTLGTQQHAPLLDIEVPAIPTQEIEYTAHTSNGANDTKGIDHKLASLNTGSPYLPDRTTFSAKEIVADIWLGLGMPPEALSAVHLTGDGLGLPSSFKIGPLAQSTIALSALAAAVVYSSREEKVVPTVTVPLLHAVAEFKSERLYVLEGKRNDDPWGPIGGLHKTSDGYVRIHDSFPNHQASALATLDIKDSHPTRSDVAVAAATWSAIDLESQAFHNKGVIAAVRSYAQWDRLAQAKAIPNFPVSIRRTTSSEACIRSWDKNLYPNFKALQGLRVLDLSRVIAAPLAAKTLTAHGADVLWVTSPRLPDLPAIDRDLARGKRTIHLDLTLKEHKEKFWELLRDADVLIQGYRPGALAAQGLAPADLLKHNSSLIIANMSAYGSSGPWAGNRGFDSLIQTCSGMNVSEAEHFGDGSAARPTPCQALDHAGGYLLATGILAALYRRSKEGGGFVVDVSLAGVMKYLRSLGQYHGRSGFDCDDITSPDQVAEISETKLSGFGKLTAVKHSAQIAGLEVGWDHMPKPLGADQPIWAN